MGLHKFRHERFAPIPFISLKVTNIFVPLAKRDLLPSEQPHTRQNACSELSESRGTPFLPPSEVDFSKSFGSL